MVLVGRRSCSRFTLYHCKRTTNTDRRSVSQVNPALSDSTGHRARLILMDAELASPEETGAIAVGSSSPEFNLLPYPIPNSQKRDKVRTGRSNPTAKY